MYARGLVLRTLAALALGSTAVSAQNGNGPAELDWRRPLASRNQAPLPLLFVYLAPDSSRVLPRGQLALDVDFDYSNIILEQKSDTDLLRFDLEYLRTLVSLRRGFSGGFELRFSVPIYVYYGGFLDPLVNSFHETFGFPNHLRSQTPYGQVDLQFQSGDRPFVGVQDSAEGVGDVSLEAKKTILAQNRYGLALR
jgi:hypothetical protein